VRALKSAALVVAAQASKILVGLVLIKLAAIYIGVEGFGKLGHLMSFVTMLTVLAGGGIVNGIIKYTAEYKKNIWNILRFISTASLYSLIFSLIIFFILLLFASDIAALLFSDPGFDWVVRLVGVTQVCIAFSNLVTGVANGYKNTKVYAIIQIIGNGLSILVIWALIRSFGIHGAAFSIAIGTSFMALPAFVFFYRSKFWKKVKLIKRSEILHFKGLFGFTLMLLVSALTFPATEIFIREMIIVDSGFSDAGLWQALIKLSSVYIGFFGLFLAYYFIPTVSPMQGSAAIRRLTFKYLSVVVLFFVLGAVLFVLFADTFLPLLLSAEFIALEPLLTYQFVGDLFKIASFVIGFVFVAKAATKIYIAAELFQNILFASLAYVFYKEGFDLVSIMHAYILTYMLYFLLSLIALFVFVRKGRLVNEL